MIVDWRSLSLFESAIANCMQNATISKEDILASEKKNDCKGSFDGAGNEESAWSSDGLIRRHTCST